MRDWNGGGVFVGRDAAALGLVDSVGSLEDLLADLNTKSTAPAQKLASPPIDTVSGPFLAAVEFTPQAQMPAQSGCPQIDAIVGAAAEYVELGTRQGFVKSCPEFLGKFRDRVSAKYGKVDMEVPDDLLRSAAMRFAEGWNIGCREERDRITSIDNLAKLMSGHDADLIHAAKFTHPITVGQLAVQIRERESSGFMGAHRFHH